MNKKLGHDAIYDARELGVPRMLLLGLQHLFAMFGATVLVPILVTGYGLPLSIQTTLLFAGIGTLLFHICTKLKVPAVLGSSFAFLGGFQAVANLDSGKFAAMTGEKSPVKWKQYQKQKQRERRSAFSRSSCRSWRVPPLIFLAYYTGHSRKMQYTSVPISCQNFRR